MGKYRLTLSREAEVQLLRVKKSGNKAVVKKINSLLEELEETPHSGTGRPEQLKYSLSGLWSRRIDKKSRLVYSIDEEEMEVCIFSLSGHYDDK